MFRLSYEKKDLGQSYALVVVMMIVSSILLTLIFGTEASGWRFWLMQGLFTVSIGASAFVYAAITNTKVFVATKLNVVPRYAHVLWGCLAALFLIACMTPINNVLLDGIEAMGLNRPSVDFEDSVIGLLFFACLLPAICEEVIFRGTIAQSLADSRNKWAVLAISGALFSIFHANPAQTIHQFVLGAWLTLLVLRSGSLWTSVIVHLFNNVLVVVLSYTPIGTDEFWSFTSNTGAVVAIMCVGLVGFVASVFGYIKTTKSTWVVDDNASYDTRDEQSVTARKSAIIRSYVMLAAAILTCVVLWFSSLFSA